LKEDRREYLQSLYQKFRVPDQTSERTLPNNISIPSNGKVSKRGHLDDYVNQLPTVDDKEKMKVTAATTAATHIIDKSEEFGKLKSEAFKFHSRSSPKG
jgi:hypothetical protein